MVAAGVGFAACGLFAQEGTESLLLPAAEEKLVVGEAGEALRLYGEAFAGASGFEERLALIGPLVRVAVLSRDLSDLAADLFVEEEAGIEEWETSVLRAALFQYLQDPASALRELAGTDRQALPAPLMGMFREQMIYWAEEQGDAAVALPFHRERFEAEPTTEHHRAYLDALLETDREAELLAHLEGRREEVSPEAELWRSLLPKVRRQGWLDSVSLHLEPVWEENRGEAAVLFALAEMRVFQERLPEAVELFWEVFEFEETVRPRDGKAYFQRLNHFFHNRFAVKNRIGAATGRYGADQCRRFSFFGLRQDVHVSGASAARDAALLYLRELLHPTDSSEEFLQRVKIGLDAETRPPAQRVLAFAGVGAPARMLAEIEAFVELGRKDVAAAEFSRMAINRFVLSTEKFPHLREPMGELARQVGANFGKDDSLEVRQRSEQVKETILQRLDLDKPGNLEGEPGPGSRADYLERMREAVEAGDPVEGERLYRELQEREDQEDLQLVLLVLAEAWQRRGDYGKSAELMAEYLRPLYSGSGGGGVAAPLDWGPRGFPPPNPYLGQADLESAGEAFQRVEEPAALKALLRVLAREKMLLLKEEQASACLLQVSFQWWDEDYDGAMEIARSCMENIDTPEMKLLFAHLLGLRERYGDANDVLDEIVREDREAWVAARRLFFSFAVAEGHRKRAAAAAADLEDVELTASEVLQVAFGLSSIGLVSEAGGWMEKLRPADLEAGEEERYQRLHLRVLLDREDFAGAKERARFLLLGEMPESFSKLSSVARLEALAALEAADGLEDYRIWLSDLLGFAPRALSLHLLSGECADFRGKSGLADPEEAAKEAMGHFRGAIALRPGAVDLKVDFSEWLAERGWVEEAVVEYQEVLELDAPSVLLNMSSLIRTYRAAGRLRSLLGFLEEWQVPEASSLDDFYGLQPTEHLFFPLGEALLDAGDRSAAERAWNKGLQINPIEFTERMRVSLAQLYVERKETAKVLELIEEYISQPNVDPQFYALQPFANATPRWIALLNAAPKPSEAPVEQLIVLAEQSGEDGALRAAAAEWRDERPGRLSSAVFQVYLAARAGQPEWEEELADIEERFAAGEGPATAAWESVELLFEGRGKGEQGGASDTSESDGLPRRSSSQ